MSFVRILAKPYRPFFFGLKSSKSLFDYPIWWVIKSIFYWSKLLLKCKYYCVWVSTNVFWQILVHSGIKQSVPKWTSRYLSAPKKCQYALAHTSICYNIPVYAIIYQHALVYTSIHLCMSVYMMINQQVLVCTSMP